MDPAAPLRDIAVDIVDERLAKGMPAVATAADPLKIIEEEKAKRAGQMREWQSIPLAPGESRAALGIEKSQATASALDAAVRATALVVGTHAKRVGGFGEIVKLTRRSVVPVNREKEVIEESRRTLRTALGGELPKPDANDVINLSPEYIRTWLGTPASEPTAVRFCAVDHSSAPRSTVPVAKKRLPSTAAKFSAWKL